MTRIRAALLCCAVVTLAGCVGGLPAGQNPDDVRTVTTTPDATTTTPETVACDDQLWVSYYGLSGGRSLGWRSDGVLVGYTVPADGTYFFVATEAETVLGSDSVSVDHAITADGSQIELDRSLSGTHSVSVTVHRDSNANGEFDPGTDPVCTNDGERVTTGPTEIDFSRFATGTSQPATSTPTTVAGTAMPTTTSAGTATTGTAAGTATTVVADPTTPAPTQTPTPTPTRTETLTPTATPASANASA